MRDLPKIFPISLAVLLIMVFFMGAYVISAQAAYDAAQPAAQYAEAAPDNNFVETGAFLVCPFH